MDLHPFRGPRAQDLAHSAKTDRNANIGDEGHVTSHGGGLERKLWRLRHEGAMSGEQGRLV
jgi:hypothetical protein